MTGRKCGRKGEGKEANDKFKQWLPVLEWKQFKPTKINALQYLQKKRKQGGDEQEDKRRETKCWAAILETKIFVLISQIEFDSFPIAGFRMVQIPLHLCLTNLRYTLAQSHRELFRTRRDFQGSRYAPIGRPLFGEIALPRSWPVGIILAVSKQ